jgi:hypothetical protein
MFRQEHSFSVSFFAMFPQEHYPHSASTAMPAYEKRKIAPAGTLNEFCTEFFILHTLPHCFRNMNRIMLR